MNEETDVQTVSLFNQMVPANPGWWIVGLFESKDGESDYLWRAPIVAWGFNDCWYLEDGIPNAVSQARPRFPHESWHESYPFSWNEPRFYSAAPQYITEDHFTALPVKKDKNA